MEQRQQWQETLKVELAQSEGLAAEFPRWSDIPVMSTNRYNHTATLLHSGKVLVAGGTNATANALTSSELYDLNTRTWSPTLNPMTTARFNHTATLLPSGKVLVTGGADSTGHALASSELYDPVSNTWEAISTDPKPHARFSHTATLLLDGQVLFAGGTTAQPLRSR